MKVIIVPFTEPELVKELLYGASFLERFEGQLTSLRSEPSFVELIDTIRTQAYERFGEPLQDEKRFASDALYKSGAVRTYKPLSEIVDSVKADGYTMSSALITTYLAMYLLDSNAKPSVIGAQPVAPQVAQAPFNEADFRLRWKAEYRCEDGHYVRSKNEAIVDNWLYSHGICHAYEKAVFDPDSGDTLCSDFFVPAMNLYIEIWGMATQEYAIRRERKVDLYRKLSCRLLEIHGDAVKNIDDVLSREFANHMQARA